MNIYALKYEYNTDADNDRLPYMAQQYVLGTSFAQAEVLAGNYILDSGKDIHLERIEYLGKVTPEVK